MNNGYYPFPFKQGSKRDMTLAYILRGVSIVLLTSLVYCGVGIRDDTRDFKKELPKIQEHLNGLENQMQAQEERAKTFATKDELRTEAAKVSHEFRKLLQEQIEAAKLQTGGAEKRRP